MVTNRHRHSRSKEPIEVSSRGLVAARNWQAPPQSRSQNLLVVTRGLRVMAEIVIYSSRPRDLETIEDRIVAALRDADAKG